MTNVSIIPRGALQRGERLLHIGQQVLGGLDTAGQAHHIRLDAGGGQLCIVHLAMRGVGRVQAAGAGIGNVRGDLGHMQVLHELLGRGAPPVKAKAHHAACAIGHVLLRALVIGVAGQARVAHEADGGMLL